jgi:hypothetical protein
MKSNSQKIREYFIKHPTVDPKLVGTKFKAHMSQVYMLRKQALAEAPASSEPIIEYGYVNDQITDAVTQANRKQVGGDHYMNMGVQPWKAMESWMTYEEFRGFLKGNAIKYLARSNAKGGVEDVKKAGHYIEKLVEVMGDA